MLPKDRTFGLTIERGNHYTTGPVLRHDCTWLKYYKFRQIFATFVPAEELTYAYTRSHWLELLPLVMRVDGPNPPHRHTLYVALLIQSEAVQLSS